MKKIALLGLAFSLIFAGAAMATGGNCPQPPVTGGSSDVKAYGDIEAAYGQGVTNTQASECGAVFTHKSSVTAEARGMGALNHVGTCGALGVIDGQVSATCTDSVVMATYTVKSQGVEMAGAADMSGVAGVAACATGAAGASGYSNLAQDLHQINTSFNYGPGFAGVGTQCYNGSVNIGTQAHAGR